MIRLVLFSALPPEPLVAAGDADPPTVRTRVGKDPRLTSLLSRQPSGPLRRDAPRPGQIAEILKRIANRREAEVDERHRRAIAKHGVVRTRIVTTDHVSADDWPTYPKESSWPARAARCANLVRHLLRSHMPIPDL